MFIWVEFMIERADISKGWLVFWIFLAIIFNLFFLVELILHFVAFNVKWVLKQKKILILEILLQALSIWAIIDFLFADFKMALQGIKLFCIVYLLRCLRLLGLISEL